MKKNPTKDLGLGSLPTPSSAGFSALPPGTHATLFANVLQFYTQLLKDLESAQEAVSMLYHAFDYGEWSLRISKALMARAQSGVLVRLMIDGLGLVVEKPRHFFRNLSLIRSLRAGGVQVEVFIPTGTHLSIVNRLHAKLCAIDDHKAFLGGSNIGDHYLVWDDTNVRLQGQLMHSLHDVYDEARHCSSRSSSMDASCSEVRSWNSAIKLTIPGVKEDIRTALMELIEGGNQSVNVRSWSFLPDEQILRALIRKARSGVEVSILTSHRTRVRPLDLINPLACRQIAEAGGRIYRYTERYMHAKVAWNNRGDVLLGSANINSTGVSSNFECCIAVRDPVLRDELHRRFLKDASGCLQPYAQRA